MGSVDALSGQVQDVDAGDTAFVRRTALATAQYTATFPPGSPAQARATYDPDGFFTQPQDF